MVSRLSGKKVPLVSLVNKAFHHFALLYNDWTIPFQIVLQPGKLYIILERCRLCIGTVAAWLEIQVVQLGVKWTHSLVYIWLEISSCDDANIRVMLQWIINSVLLEKYSCKCFSIVIVHYGDATEASTSC